YTGLVSLGGQGAKDLVFENNMAPNSLIRVFYWQALRMVGNVFSKNSSMIEFYHEDRPADLATKYTWDNNTYFSEEHRYNPFAYYRKDDDATIESRGMKFAAWQDFTPFDGNSNYTKGSLSGTKVIVRPNKYERGRAHIAIYN